MLLVLRRERWTDTFTIGRLFVNNFFECYTLEDRVRPKGIKVKAKTAIPYGVYEVVMDYSPKFKKVMPHLLNVPKFVGIRMHSGNREIDTAGCILVGANLGKDMVLDSKVAEKRLNGLLMDAVNNGDKIAIIVYSIPADFVLP
jgi:hypothetical protein